MRRMKLTTLMKRNLHWWHGLGVPQNTHSTISLSQGLSLPRGNQSKWRCCFRLPLFVKSPLGFTQYLSLCRSFLSLFILIGHVINQWTKKLDFNFSAKIFICSSFRVLLFHFWFSMMFNDCWSHIKSKLILINSTRVIYEGVWRKVI